MWFSMFLLIEYDDNKWIQDFQMSKYINIWHGFTIETFHYKEKHMRYLTFLGQIKIAYML